MCSIFLPVQGDVLFLPVFARLDGLKLLEWTTQPPPEFPVFSGGNSLFKMAEISGVPGGGIAPAGTE